MEYKLLHTCIRVRDLEKSLEFYERVLGLRETRRKEFPLEDFSLVFLSDERRQYEIELTYNYDRSEAYAIGNGFGHIALSAEDLEESHKRHTEMGYRVSKLMGLPGSPPRFYFITDPDGYEIEIVRA